MTGYRIQEQDTGPDQTRQPDTDDSNRIQIQIQIQDTADQITGPDHQIRYTRYRYGYRYRYRYYYTQAHVPGEKPKHLAES